MFDDLAEKIFQAQQEMALPKTNGIIMPVVAIVGSSGSLTIIQQLLAQLPANFSAPILVAKHISPKYPSSLERILQSSTSLTVKEARNDETMEKSTVYVVPPGQNIAIKSDRHLQLTQFSQSAQFVCPCANILLNSMALVLGSQAIAIILTGTGNDGTEGIKAINAHHGVAIVQNRETSEFLGMPSAAIRAGVAQYILPQAHIAATVIRLVAQISCQSTSTPQNLQIPMTDQDENQTLEFLLDYLRRMRGFDFTGYKRPSLRRRIQKRMQALKIETFEDYWDYLQVHPEEFPVLFNTILINVTGFFRDAETWKYLREQVIPGILSKTSKTSPIRVWTAGCASGEEPYSMGMLLIEELGLEAFQDRVKIYATDIDEEALTQARQAIYSQKDVESIPKHLRDKYLEPSQNDCYTFCNELRRATIFGRHNLIEDAPISRLDLLVCRNTLMYFDAETQGRILARFHFALNDESALFLGKAEMLLGHSRLFAPLSLPHRVFKKVTPINLRQRLLTLASANDTEIGNRLSLNEQLQTAAFDNIAIPHIVLDYQGRLVMANLKAQSQFNLNARQLGIPFQDLELSYRPAELRSSIDQAYRDRNTVIVSDVARTFTNGTVQYLEIRVTPLIDPQSQIIGVSLSFLDTTDIHQLQDKLERSNHELETTNEELQSTNEELETTNEELQSSNEELETTNEELQSTNEELETINEELQSSNEELQAINEESRKRTIELNQANAFLNSILISFDAAIVVLDRDLNILSWNPEAENLWGLRSDEVKNQNFMELDINLPVSRLHDSIQACLSDSRETSQMSLEAINRRGRSILCHISFSPLMNHEQERLGVILLMDASENNNNE